MEQPQAAAKALLRLEEPFASKEVKWIVKATSRDGRKGRVVPYADPRAYTDRLNQVFTASGWTRQYTVHTVSPITRVRKDKSIQTGKVMVTCVVSIPGFGSHTGNGEEWADDENAMTSAESLMAKHSISLFGLYCDYNNQSEVESAIRAIKGHYTVPVIVGGPQSRVLTQKFFDRTGCDFVAIGEAEVTFTTLLDALVKHDRALFSIPGLVIADSNGKIHATGEPELLPSLDDIPPNHQLVHLCPIPRTDTLQVLSSRGCPYRCTYCHESSSVVRYRSIQHIVSQIESALTANPEIRKVFFVDNTSTLNPARVLELCDQLQRLREHWDFVWGCESHIHFIDRTPGLLRMVDSGLVRLQIGIESGNREMLRWYRKEITPDSALRAVRSAQEAGLPFVKTNFILGGPEESWESVEDSLSLAKALVEAAPGCMEITTSFLAPYPLSDIASHPDRYHLPDR